MSQHIETISLHAGQSPEASTGSRAVPIYQTTSYVFKDTDHAANLFALKEFGNIYTRIMNPTTDVLEQRVATLEGGTAALCTASGMSAILLAIHTICSAGDHIISSASLYGGTDTFFRYTLPRMGVTVDFVEDLTADKIKDYVKPNTKLVYFETVGNPKGDVLDFKSISDEAHAHGLPVMVDNTFAPGLCKPIEHGVDVVIHSLTKWIGGHGTSIGGILVDGGKFDWSQGRFNDFTEPDASYHGLKYWDVFGNFPGLGNIAFAIKARVQGLRNMGMAISPSNAFQFLQGLETLPLRMEKHVSNAKALATYLKNHPNIAWVNYTGFEDHDSYARSQQYLSGKFPSVFTFGVKGGYESAKKFINKVKLASHLANVGDAKTLVIHPSSTTHQQLTQDDQMAAGVLPDMVRVSVGLEHIEDIQADFDQALRQ
ncbi:MAG: O-acetylhomoserine aminocarboxypropyltransferase/cysteine synthase family protein [Candidatus Marinamargulisbacteria bacterium]